MEKALEFSEEQKSLIWRTKVQPKMGTADDALMFMEVCEQYGLNPLLNDIVFNRYESQNGPVVNFIVSRDGYLKAAMRDVNFVKCVSAVIKEGDEFSMDIEGNVHHKFGKSRGKIIGAWAYAEHKIRGKLPVVVDFNEYFKANAKSQNGKSPVWDKMPSMMIQKTAEIAALRRQFPLGGIVVAEEIGIEFNEANNNPTPVLIPEMDTSNSETHSTPVETISSAESTEPVETEVEGTAVEEHSTNVEFDEYTELSVLAIAKAKSPVSGQLVAKVAVQSEDGTRFMMLTNQEDLIMKLDEVEASTQNPEKYLFKFKFENGHHYLMDIGGKAA